MGKSLFFLTFSLVLLVTLFMGGITYYAEENTATEERTTNEEDTSQSLINEVNQESIKEENSSQTMVQEIKEKSESFDPVTKWEQLKENSVKLLVTWIVLSGVLAFFGLKKLAVMLMIGGFVGFVFINYPEDIAAIYLSLADKLFE